LALQLALGWANYQTAWTCLHKLRRAMIRPGREGLAGVVVTMAWKRELLQPIEP